MYSERGLVGRTVQTLGRRIVGGEVAVGEILDVEAIRAEYDVSRTVVREALKVLAAKGLTDARPRRGTFVLERTHWALLDPDVLKWRFADPVDPALLRDLNEVRLIIEPSTARRAAGRATKQQIADLRRALHAMSIAEHAEDLTTADITFHKLLMATVGNELLSQIDVVIEAGLRARDLLIFATPEGRKDPDLAAHQRVLELVEHGDAEGAEEAMRQLLLSAERDVEELLVERVT